MAGAVTQGARHYPPGALILAALPALGAAAIHLSIAPAQAGVFPALEVLSVAGGALLAALAAALLLRPGRGVFGAAALVTLGLLAVWAVSATVGLPSGPTPGTPGAAGLPDTLAAAIEALFLVVTLRLATGRPRRLARGWSWMGIASLGLAVTLGTVYGVGSSLNPLPRDVTMSMVMPGDTVIPMASLVERPGNQHVKAFTLTAEVAPVNGRTAWTYNGTVPGPALHVTVGDRLRVTLINHLPVATTLHWHGVRVPNADDGVAGVTQNAVAPGGRDVYEFVVKDPGTYWYHAHQEASVQIPRGLYGALIVEPKVRPVGVHDATVIVGDANAGAAPLHVDARPGALMRLRLIDAFDSPYTGAPDLFVLLGAPYRVVALDGHDLHGPQLLGPEQIPLSMGQRADLLFRMPATGQVTVLDERTTTDTGLLRRVWATAGTGPAPDDPGAASLPLFDLTSYGTPAPDPIADRTTFDVSDDMRIDSHFGFRDGEGEAIHTINGMAAPDGMGLMVRRGQVVKLRFINDTDEDHPMHLHGHSFTVISKNGQRLTGSPVHLDTVLVGPHETWEVAFLADNPGLWMVHCHILQHAKDGLSMMISYEGVSTPYSIGTQSGNLPD